MVTNSLRVHVYEKKHRQTDVHSGLFNRNPTWEESLNVIFYICALNVEREIRRGARLEWSEGLRWETAWRFRKEGREEGRERREEGRKARCWCRKGEPYLKGLRLEQENHVLYSEFMLKDKLLNYLWIYKYLSVNSNVETWLERSSMSSTEYIWGLVAHQG